MNIVGGSEKKKNIKELEIKHEVAKWLTDELLFDIVSEWHPSDMIIQKSGLFVKEVTDRVFELANLKDCTPVRRAITKKAIAYFKTQIALIKLAKIKVAG